GEVLLVEEMGSSRELAAPLLHPPPRPPLGRVPEIDGLVIPEVVRRPVLPYRESERVLELRGPRSVAVAPAERRGDEPGQRRSCREPERGTPRIHRDVAPRLERPFE